MSRKRSHGPWETIKTVIYAFLIALFVRTFLYQPFNIPSGSMIPTLLIGDFVFVSKYSYGYSRYSFPVPLPMLTGRLWWTPPERGDVAVFALPMDSSTDYVKRVIGLPGDRIQIVGGILHINGQPVKREPLGTYETANGFGVRQTFQLYREILPNGRSHEILELSDKEPLDNTPVFEVPSRHYFMLGDNRDSSSDSRFLNRVGYIPDINLIGRAEIIHFSIDGSVLRFWEWHRSIRFERLFRRIE